VLQSTESESDWIKTLQSSGQKEKWRTWLVRGKCCQGSVIANPFFRLPQLEIDYRKLVRKQQNWPTPVAHGPDLYADFYHTTHSLATNVVCASCGTIGHDSSGFQSVSTTDRILNPLSIPDDVYVPYDFTCGVDEIDRDRIMIDKEGLSTVLERRRNRRRKS
jgi:hypothetical protein